MGKHPQRTTLWLQNEASEVSYLKGEKRCLKAEGARRIIGKEGNWIRQRGRMGETGGMKRRMKKRRFIHHDVQLRITSTELVHIGSNETQN